MNNSDKQTEKANYFRSLHNRHLLLLPNAWNGGSAKVFEKSGFKAIGTTSAGIAYSMGYTDGEQIEFTHIVRVVKEIAKVTSLPLTVDVERGYSNKTEDILKNIELIIEAGAVGINIEDGNPSENRVDTDKEFEEKLRAISELREKLKIPFFINARTDIYLLNISSPSAMFEETIKRAELIKNCGADSIFIPGALDRDTIIKLRKAIDIPLNLFVHQTFNDTDQLKSIGIDRLSSGSAPVRTTFSTLMETADAFNKGNCSTMLNHELDYSSANTFFR